MVARVRLGRFCSTAPDRQAATATCACRAPQGEGSKRQLSALGNVAACVSAGFVETTCYAPFEHIKTQMQTQYGRGGSGGTSTPGCHGPCGKTGPEPRRRLLPPC